MKHSNEDEPNLEVIPDKTEDRKKLEAMMKDYMAKGGKIVKYPAGKEEPIEEKKKYKRRK